MVSKCTKISEKSLAIEGQFLPLNFVQFHRNEEIQCWWKFKPSGLGSQRGRLPRTSSAAIVVQALRAKNAIDELFLPYHDRDFNSADIAQRAPLAMVVLS